MGASKKSKKSPKTRPLAKTKRANRQFKSSFFIKALRDSGELIAVSNAFLGTHYSVDTKVKIRTLQNVLATGRKNDLAFELDNRLIILIEHQSTVNENMPYRILQYIAATYDFLNADDDVYRKDKFTILRPKFIVFYNGVQRLPQEVVTLRLSDMFAPLGEDAADVGADLELTVKVYDINDGRNADKLKSCETLRGYSIFTSRVRLHQKTMSQKEAILRAAAECINENVLKEFLEKHKKELVSMLTAEWSMDTALRVAGEEGEARGKKRGEKIGEKRERERAEQEKEAMAAAMKAKGMDADTIAEITGFTVDKILRM